METTHFRAEEAELKFRRFDIAECEDNEERITILRNFGRRVHCGLISMEVLLEIQDLRTVISYDVLGEMNAGNFLARRSLQDMQATEGQYRRYQERAINERRV